MKPDLTHSNLISLTQVNGLTHTERGHISIIDKTPHEPAWPAWPRVTPHKPAWQRMTPHDNGWTRMDSDELECTRMNSWWIIFFIRLIGVLARSEHFWKKKWFFSRKFFFENFSKISKKFFFSEDFLQKCSDHAKTPINRIKKIIHQEFIRVHLSPSEFIRVHPRSSVVMRVHPLSCGFTAGSWGVLSAIKWGPLQVHIRIKKCVYERWCICDLYAHNAHSYQE